MFGRRESLFETKTYMNRTTTVLVYILEFHVTSQISVGVNSKSRHRQGSELNVQSMCNFLSFALSNTA